MLIAAIVSALIAFPVEQEKFSFSMIAKLTFACRSDYKDPAGQKLLDQAIHETHVDCMDTWGFQHLIQVEPSAVPRIAAYLIPRLQANKQRLVIAHDSLILEPETKQVVFETPTKKHKRLKA